MSSFISLKNKLSSSYNLSEENKNDSKKLILPSIIDQDFSFNKQRREIILCENRYILGSLWEETYTFNGLSDSQLQFIHPYIVLSTSDGNANRDSWVYLTSNWWENYSISSISDVKILKIRVMGYILITDDSEVSRSDLAPIYATIKLKILNNKLFDLLTNSRT